MTTRQTPDAVREAEETVRNALMDSQYLAGVTAGWNAAQADDPEAALAALRNSREGHLAGYAEAKAILAALDSRAGDAGEGVRMWQVKGPCETIMWETNRTSGQFADPIVAVRCALSLPIPATPAPAVDAKARADMAAALRNTPAEALREAGYLERAAQMIEAPAVDAVPAGEVDRLARIRTSMALLQQNSEGCALNHYGDDATLHGMPGWLNDTKADLDAFTDLLTKWEADRG